MVVEKVDLDRLYQEQIRQEQEEKSKLYKKVKELTDELYAVKTKMDNLEFQSREYQDIIKELSAKLVKRNGEN
jgi:predicted nuclease with TOPRIM domain